MAIYYLPSIKTFMPFPPLNEVREDMYGKDVGGTLYYPGVSSCTTITLQLTDGSLLGTHWSKGIPESSIGAIMTQLKVVRGRRGITAVYLVGRMVDRQNTVSKKAGYDWPNLPSRLYKELGQPKRAVFKAFKQPEGTYHYVVNNNAAQARFAYQLPTVANAPLEKGGPWTPLNEFESLPYGKR